MTIGGILGESWRLYTKFFVRFFLIALIVYGIVNLVNALVATFFGDSVGVSLLLALLTTVVSLVGTFWLQGALVFAVDDVRDGRIDSTIGEVFERVRPFLGTLIVAGILAGLGIAAGARAAHRAGPDPAHVVVPYRACDRPRAPVGGRGLLPLAGARARARLDRVRHRGADGARDRRCERADRGDLLVPSVVPPLLDRRRDRQLGHRGRSSRSC